MADGKPAQRRKGRPKEAPSRGPGRFEDDLPRLLSHAVQQSPSQVLITDARGRIEYVNPRFTEDTGFCADEVIGKRVNDLSDLTAEAKAELWDALTSQGEWRGEIRSKNKDGSVHWVSASIHAVRTPEGDGTHYVGLGEDISARKHAEDNLRDSEEKFRILAETTTASTFIYQGTKYLYVNAASEAILGYSREELMSMNVWETVHPDHREMAKERALARKRGEDVPSRYEIKSLTKSGEVRWLDVAVEAIEFEGLPAVIGTAFDITERKRAEEALRESEARHRALLELVPDMMFRISEDLTFLEFIPGKHVRPLMPPDQFIGKRVPDVLPGHVAETVAVSLRQALRTGEVQTFEHDLTVDERRRDFEARIVAINGDEALAIVRDVTDRKLAEEAQRESEERFRNAFEHAPTGMALVGLDSRLLRVNRPCWETLGYSEGELTSMTWQDVTHPDDVSSTISSLRRVLVGQAELVQLEKRFVHKDGRVFWGRLTSSLLRDADGRPAYFITQIQDITERRRAERALRESEERYRELVENINETIYEIDEAGQITYISPVAEQAGDYPLAEFYGRHISDFIHPEDIDRIQETLRRAMAGHSTPFEFRLVSRSGEERWHRSFARQVKKDGRVVGLRGVLTDIAESKRSEEALRESEERFRTLYEHNPSMYFTVNTEGIVLSVNRFGVEQLGYAADELVGDSVLKVFHDDDKEKVRQQLASCVGSLGEVAEWEFRKVRKNGDVIWVKEVARAVRGTDGETIVLIVCEDITERRRADEALQEVREELEMAVEDRMQRGNAYGLTFRELTVLHLVAAGKVDREIGVILGISPRTVNKHVENILFKTKSSTRTEAGVRAVREGIVP